MAIVNYINANPRSKTMRYYQSIPIENSTVHSTTNYQAGSSEPEE